jgi:hypothetical protein
MTNYIIGNTTINNTPNLYWQQAVARLNLI